MSEQVIAYIFVGLGAIASWEIVCCLVSSLFRVFQ